ncbi:Lipoprotein signal peptidase [Candidatus Filomicrobium marinum]|uniref:Lipoprotein signal peptidase n=1 Tax=Candidatus Filomicrobium marinum TaxID=1608628 RepID=A0A0D6JJH0_9HYPH|nr:signal peptidase II [Candidatus Filomicrobium marinum]CFX34563.1 Lipoprotein signal peptidase [Candidatus Filomicrobium marinum]CPR21852.1 Lipoprotein signal peptidase [Candidatus Filomicrobium marinum]
MRAPVVGALCVVAAFALDQATKAVALGASALATGVEVLPVLNLVLVHNHGVSFGMLAGITPWWALSCLSLTIVGALSIWLWRAHDGLLGAALGLVIGGALGNVLDRLRHGAVIDFLDVHLGAYHWPAFNLADVAVVCGVGLLLLQHWRETSEQVAARRSGGSPDRR